MSICRTSSFTLFQPNATSPTLLSSADADVVCSRRCVSRSVTAGIDALGEVTVRVQDELSKREYIGKAADTDVVHASAEAYLHAVNRLLSNRGEPDKAHPQKDVL